MDDERACHGLKSRIGALVGFWEGLREGVAPRKQLSGTCGASVGNGSKDGGKDGGRELFKPYRAPEPQFDPPPSYDDSITDLPPDYTATDALAAVCFSSLPLDGVPAERKQEGKSNTGLFELDVKVDLSEVEGVRSHANKKAKKAAKAAQQAKWADSGDEGEKKEGEEGTGDGGGGEDAGGGAGGDGGDPPGGGDGGGGDDGDDFFAGFGKKDVSG